MKSLILFSIISFLFLTGCTTTSVTETIYLQNIKITGPVNHPPLHITNGQKSGTFTISPKFSFNSINAFSGKLDGHTPVNERGYFQVDTVPGSNTTRLYKESASNKYDFRGENLKWEVPGASFGLDADISVSDHFAFFGGLNYVVENQKELFGGTAGIGFYSEKEKHSIRFDFGVAWQSMFYDASTVVVTEVDPAIGSSYSYVTFYRDKDKSSTANLFASFTYNTAFEDFPLNFFINASYFSQTLFDFEPERTDVDYYPFAYRETTIDARGEATASFISFSPGIYQKIGDLGRIALGVKMIKETQLKNTSDSFFILPVFQFDLSL